MDHNDAPPPYCPPALDPALLTDGPCIYTISPVTPSQASRVTILGTRFREVSTSVSPNFQLAEVEALDM
jgi:hypothetical protein